MYVCVCVCVFLGVTSRSFLFRVFHWLHLGVARLVWLARLASILLLKQIFMPSLCLCIIYLYKYVQIVYIVCA